jgi:fumarate hydratase subunit beta
VSIHIHAPFNEQTIAALKSGDRVTISGTVYTARDAAHKRLTEELARGIQPPFVLNGQVLYYVGPTPTQPGQVIGSAGPTTSGRMDKYTPTLLELGLKGMIGKGFRDVSVREAIVRHKAIYLAAIGGTGALLARSIQKVEIIAYEDLGTEAIRKLTIEHFPAVVINDIYGNDLYEDGVQNFQKNE